MACWYSAEYATVMGPVISTYDNDDDYYYCYHIRHWSTVVLAVAENTCDDPYYCLRYRLAG